MFDFTKLGMFPTYSSDFKEPAKDSQISELEKYLGHSLPETYNTILKNYNGASLKANCFDVPDRDTGVLCEMRLNRFYYLSEEKEDPEFSDNIWWLIRNFSEGIGSDSLPFADDGLGQIYYLKWANNIPQVWFLAYLDLDEPETHCVSSSFDDFLNSLYIGREQN